jgi:hypothetical protein
MRNALFTPFLIKSNTTLGNEFPASNNSQFVQKVESQILPWNQAFLVVGAENICHAYINNMDGA